MSKFWGLVLKILNMALTQIDAFFAFFAHILEFWRNVAIKPVLFVIKTESLKCCLTYRENRESKACFVLEILRVVVITVEPIEAKCWLVTKMSKFWGLVLKILNMASDNCSQLQLSP